MVEGDHECGYIMIHGPWCSCIGAEHTAAAASAPGQCPDTNRHFLNVYNMYIKPPVEQWTLSEENKYCAWKEGSVNLGPVDSSSACAALAERAGSACGGIISYYTDPVYVSADPSCSCHRECDMYEEAEGFQIFTKAT